MSHDCQTPQLSQDAAAPKGLVRRNIKIFVSLGALFLLLVASILGFRARKRPPVGAAAKIPAPPPMYYHPARTVADATKQIPGMRQYVDTDFSFWYPAAGTVTREDGVNDRYDSDWYRGGTALRHFSVSVPSDFVAGGHEGVLVVELYVPTGVLTVTGSKETFFFGRKADAADYDDFKTVGGLPMYWGDEHGETLIVPLDRTHFVVLDHESGTKTTLDLAETIVAGGLDGAKRISPQQLAEAVHLEAMKMGVMGQPVGDGWSTDGQYIYNTIPKWKRLPGVDPKTFTVLPGGDRYFATDGAHVYYGNGGEAIPEADPKTFVPREFKGANEPGPWCKDSRHVYTLVAHHTWKILPGVDPNKFAPYSEDFVPNAWFATDGIHVYDFNGVAIPDADPKTFAAIGLPGVSGPGDWYKDNEHVYRHISDQKWEVVTDADPKNFAPMSEHGLNAFFATDGTHVYDERSMEIPEADPKTFVASGRDSARDALHKYRLSGEKWKVDGMVLPQ